MKNLSKFILFLHFALLTAGCGPSTEEKSAYETSVGSLRKLSALTKVGADQTEFKRLLVEASAIIESNQPKIRNQDAKARLQSALEAFTDSLRAWQLEAVIKKDRNSIHLRAIFRKKGETAVNDNAKPYTVFIQKYEIPFQWNVYNTNQESLEYEDAVRHIWEHAYKQIALADKAFGS
jgi:hypothetical protein